MKRRFLFFFVITLILPEFLSIKLSMDIRYLEKKTIVYRAELTFLMEQNSIDGRMVRLLSHFVTDAKIHVNPTPKFVRVVSYEVEGQRMIERDAAFQLRITDATTSKVLFETKQWHSGINTYFSLQEEKKWVKIIIDSISSDLKDITIVFTSSRGSTKVRLFHENNSHIKPSDTWVFDLTWYVPLQSMYYNGHSHEFGVKVQNLTDNGYMLVEEHFGNGLTMDLPRCSSTRYGPSCESHCYCDNEPCDLDTGHCTRGCRAGFQGPTCNTRCSSTRYGPSCESHCYCDNEPCDLHTGHCTHGCRAGFQGPTCNTTCPPGKYGKQCEKECGACSGWKPCNTTTGKCHYGCIGKFIPPSCKECQAGWFGPECGEQCGYCKGGVLCDSYVGKCPEGCTEGFMEPFCQIPINNLMVIKNNTRNTRGRLHSCSWYHSTFLYSVLYIYLSVKIFI